MRPRPEEELEALYRRYRGDVYRYALLISRDEDEADEVTQTAFLSAYRALARGGSPRSPRAWLLAIAENARRRRQRRPHEVPLPESYEAPAPEPDVSAAELVAAIGSLPDPQRRALLLREFGGRSYDEIAETLDTSVGAVQMLLFRARRELRERLKRVAGVPAPFWEWFGSGSPALRAGAAAAGALVLAIGAGGSAPSAKPFGPIPEAGLSVPAATPVTRVARTPHLTSALSGQAGGAATAVALSAPLNAPTQQPAETPVQAPTVASPGASPVASPGASPGASPAAPGGPTGPGAPAPGAVPSPVGPLPLPTAEPAPAPPLPSTPPAPALPALPPTPSPSPQVPSNPVPSVPVPTVPVPSVPVPPLPVLEPPALPAPPQLPEAPTLPELGGAPLPQPVAS